MGGRYIPSLLAAIGEVIEWHMIEIGFMGQRNRSLSGIQPLAHSLPQEGARARFCPRCGDATLIALEGCDSCLSYDHSKCK